MFLKTETDLYIKFKPLYLIYWFFLWPVWPLSLWFHFLIKVLLMWMLICCGQNQYYVVNVYGLCLSLKPLCLISLIALWFISCISLIFDYLLANESFKPKNYKKQFPFSFSCFGIVLSSFLCSLGKISSTNTWGRNTDFLDKNCDVAYSNKSFS